MYTIWEVLFAMVEIQLVLFLIYYVIYLKRKNKRAQKNEAELNESIDTKLDKLLTEVKEANKSKSVYCKGLSQTQIKSVVEAVQNVKLDDKPLTEKFSIIDSKLDEIKSNTEVQEFIMNYMFGLSLELEAFNHIIKNCSKFEKKFTVDDVYWNIFPDKNGTRHQTDIVINSKAGLIVIECKNLNGGLGTKDNTATNWSKKWAYTYDIGNHKMYSRNNEIKSPVVQLTKNANKIYETAKLSELDSVAEDAIPLAELNCKKIVLVSMDNNNSLNPINAALNTSEKKHYTFTRFCTINDLIKIIEELTNDKPTNRSCEEIYNRLKVELPKMQNFSFNLSR